MCVASAVLVLTDVVLRARLNARTLHPIDSLLDENAREESIRTESLPVASTEWRSTKCTNDGTQSYVGAFASELCAHVLSTLTNQRPVPRSCR